MLHHGEMWQGKRHHKSQLAQGRGLYQVGGQICDHLVPLVKGVELYHPMTRNIKGR